MPARPLRRCSRAALTLVEILVVIAILGVLLAILLPILLVQGEKSRSAVCTANLRQIGAALAMYVSDNDGIYPPVTTATFVQGASTEAESKDWRELLFPYLSSKTTFPTCPTATTPADWAESYRMSPAASGYALNAGLAESMALGTRASTLSGKQENTVRYPALTVAVLDARVSLIGLSEPDNEESKADSTRSLVRGAQRHNNGANYLFADGHVKRYLPDQLRTGEEPGDGVHPGFGL